MTVKLNPSDQNSIGAEEAKKCIENFQNKHPGTPNNFFFGEDLIVRVIGQNDAVGFKMYLGYSQENSLQLIMVGTREDSSEIWPTDPSNRHIGIGIPNSDSISMEKQDI